MAHLSTILPLLWHLAPDLSGLGLLLLRRLRLRCVLRGLGAQTLRLAACLRDLRLGPGILGILGIQWGSKGDGGDGLEFLRGNLWKSGGTRSYQAQNHEDLVCFHVVHVVDTVQDGAFVTWTTTNYSQRCDGA